MAPSGLYARLCHAFLVSSFFTLSKATVSQYLLDRFSRSFHQMEGICVNFLDPVSFSDSSRDVAMAINFVAKLWQNYLPPALIALSFQSGIRYYYLNVHVNSINDVSISCENFVKIRFSNFRVDRAYF